MKYHPRICTLVLFAILFGFLGSAHAALISKKLNKSIIYGNYPFFESLGTIMYHSPSDGNRGGFDSNGSRVPTVGSIIGFNDLTCQNKAYDFSMHPVFQTKYAFWSSYFNLNDFDKDSCFNAGALNVEWFIIDPVDINYVYSWEEIASRSISINTYFPSAIISPNTEEFIQVDPTTNRPIFVPISGKYTSAMRVPQAAVGKYIGVKVSPKTLTGNPLQSKAIELWDLRYFFFQVPPSNPGLILKDSRSLKSFKSYLNTYDLGSGGGKVLPELERPEVVNVKVKGKFAIGEKLTLSYDFIAYPKTNPTPRPEIDKSVFFWGNSWTTQLPSFNYNETFSLSQNLIKNTHDVVITQDKFITLDAASVGKVAEVTILPIRQNTNEPKPIAGKTVTISKNQFEIDNVTPPPPPPPPTGPENTMFGAKLPFAHQPNLNNIDYFPNYKPEVKPYGKGYPSIGFRGAKFILLAEGTDETKNSNWTWEVVENKDHVRVNAKGEVELLSIPRRNTVTRIQAKLKSNPAIVLNHSFTIDKWLLNLIEVNNAPLESPLTHPQYTFDMAKRICDNFTRSDFKRAYLPALADLSSEPADPLDDSQSMYSFRLSGAFYDVYTFPSDNVFSQWGKIGFYTDPYNIFAYPFKSSNTGWFFVRDKYKDTDWPMNVSYTSDFRMGQWYALKPDNVFRTRPVACIVYGEDFMP